jgi:DNA-binding XRE family transcriptional regulator
MDAKEFVRLRRILNKTQKQIAQLLGTSLKAIHSYEQGWRTIPGHAERQILYLLARKMGLHQQCWTIRRCPPQRRKQCPAYEFNAGEVCWFINGTICDCCEQDTWKKKIAICRQCEAFGQLLKSLGEDETP